MVNTSDRPVVVDGVRLDTLAWNITKLNRSTAGRRSADVTVPGHDGVVPSLNDPLEPANFGLEMFVMGSDADGAVPAAGKRDTLRANLDDLLALFGTRHRLIEVSEWLTAGTMTTNLVRNPGFENGSIAPWANAGNAAVALDAAVAFSGTRSMSVTAIAAGTLTAICNYASSGSSVVAGTSYHMVARVRAATAARSAVVTAYWYSASGAYLGLTPTPAVATVVGAWVTGGGVVVAPAGAVYVGVAVVINGNAAGDVHNVDAIQMAEGTTTVPYFDGSTPNDATYTYTWTGAPWASETNRTPRRRRAWAKVVDAIAPDVSMTGGAAQLTVGLVVPSGVWEDGATEDWTSAQLVSGAQQEVTTLAGATERIQDGVVLLQGPCNAGTKITDPATGASMTLNQALSSTQAWRVNVDTWATRWGTGLTLDSTDTTGTDASSITSYGGVRGQTSLLPLTPVRTSGARRVRVVATGTGFTAATRLQLRASRKFAA